MNDRPPMDPVLSMFFEPCRELDPTYADLLAQHLYNPDMVKEVVHWLHATNSSGDLLMLLWESALKGDTAKARSDIRAYVDAYLDELDGAE